MYGRPFSDDRPPKRNGPLEIGVRAKASETGEGRERIGIT